MRSHPTAGQATLDYIAAIALVAVVLLVATPAVGAPDIPRALVAAVRHALCVVGGDVCSGGDARRAGLAPCPLKSDTTGGEASVSVFSIDVGGRWVLTVTPRSDGSVSVVRTAAGGAGTGGGPGVGVTLGPIAFGAGVSGGLRARVTAARGWEFRDAATAQRFLEHAVKHSFDGDRWPWAWQSGELSREASVSAGVSAGADGIVGGKLVGVSASAQSAFGVRARRDGSTTVFSRVALSGPHVSVAFLPAPLGSGSAEWVAELTRGPRGEPRELAFRTATAPVAGDAQTEVVARLDLTDPANLAAARPFLDSRVPWSAPGGPGKRAALDRIATHGTVERLVSRVDDDSRGASISVDAGLKFSVGGRRVRVHRQLVEATVQRGALRGRRLDCVAAAG